MGPERVKLGSKWYAVDEGDKEPKTSSSTIFAQLFAVLPFTVTLTYLASVAGMMYFSEFSVVPLLSPLNLLVNVVPSVDVAMTK